ncbi:DnaJ chaperone protein [Trypanosoma theileri]|uniref:DnaJ chaperone protein n=1 Tax=Trypanosoma theileri TaxID=67003 RepID=A0A1X0NSQ5_9TRYP|nr:DnaJ chaperone protein [Trypanosoma theileri]ORC87219.1 DnaJ chaperone protein [Trypanosoma theileri]
MTTDTTHVQKHTVLHLTYYEIFSLDPTAKNIDLDAVQRAYRRFALLFHPDKDPTPAAREAFDRIKLAAETLADPQKRRDYDEELLHASHRQDRQEGIGSARQRQQQEEMEEEARMADMILRQKEAESAAKAAATREEEEEKEAAAKQMLHELTNVLTTPFKRMESALVYEWDIDEDLLQMKEKEVDALMRKLRQYDNTHGGEQNDTVGVRTAGTKRERSEI